MGLTSVLRLHQDHLEVLVKISDNLNACWTTTNDQQPWQGDLFIQPTQRIQDPAIWIFRAQGHEQSVTIGTQPRDPRIFEAFLGTCCDRGQVFQLRMKGREKGSKECIPSNQDPAQGAKQNLVVKIFDKLSHVGCCLLFSREKYHDRPGTALGARYLDVLKVALGILRAKNHQPTWVMPQTSCTIFRRKSLKITIKMYHTF